jgi:hypothetical protein
MAFSESGFREFVEAILEDKLVFLYCGPGHGPGSCNPEVRFGYDDPEESSGSFILKTPRLGGRQIAVAYSWERGSEKIRCLTQGLNSEELHDIFLLQGCISSNFNAIIEGLLKLMVDVHTLNIKHSVETLQRYRSEIATRDLKNTSLSMFNGLNTAKASLVNAGSSTHSLNISGGVFFRIFRTAKCCYCFPIKYLEAIVESRIDEIECLTGTR